MPQNQVCEKEWERKKKTGKGREGSYLVDDIDNRVAVLWIQCCYGNTVVARGESNLYRCGLSFGGHVGPTDWKSCNHTIVLLSLKR